jgi:hypothetical protein
MPRLNVDSVARTTVFAVRGFSLTIYRARIPQTPARGFDYHGAFRIKDADRKGGGPRYQLPPSGRLAVIPIIRICASG